MDADIVQLNEVWRAEIDALYEEAQAAIRADAAERNFSGSTGEQEALRRLDEQHARVLDLLTQTTRRARETQTPELLLGFASSIPLGWQLRPHVIAITRALRQIAPHSD